jgi:hypothetical protein
LSLIFDTVRLVNVEILPINFSQLSLFFQDSLVGSDEDVPFLFSGGRVNRHMFRFEAMTFFFGATHADGTNGGTPHFEFTTPISDDTLWNYDNVGSLDTTMFPKIGQEGNRLKRFSQTHL